MIIQQEILNIVKAVGSAVFGGGGTAVAASGGFFPASPQYAASGLSGVSSVSSPTYFPKFNVIAGEAGREMLTVLARPKFMEIGGMEAVVGKAGSNTLAITNANDLANRGGTASGHITIEIQHSEESKAKIIESSVNGAEIRITQRVQQNTPLRSAIKKSI